MGKEKKKFLGHFERSFCFGNGVNRRDYDFQVLNWCDCVEIRNMVLITRDIGWDGWSLVSQSVVWLSRSVWVLGWLGGVSICFLLHLFFGFFHPCEFYEIFQEFL